MFSTTMHRRFTSLVKGQGSTSLDDSASTQKEVLPELPAPKLEIKRVDHYYSRWTRQWKYRNMSSAVAIEPRPRVKLGENDPWKDYCFVVVRTIPKPSSDGDEPGPPTFKFVIKSDYLVKGLKDVICSWPGLSWHSTPLEIAPELLLTYFPKFTAYEDKVNSDAAATEEERHAASSISAVVSSLSSDFEHTLATIRNLTKYGEITFDVLYAIFIPHSIVIAECGVTGEPRAFELLFWQQRMSVCGGYLQLTLESVDMVDRPRDMAQAGRVRTVVELREFMGTVNICELDAYPIEFHPQRDELERKLRERGKKWSSLAGIHHMEYEGIAAIRSGMSVIRHHVNSRIMVDRGTFKKLKPNYNFPTASKSTETNRNRVRDDDDEVLSVTSTADKAIRTTKPTEKVELDDTDLMLTPTTVYGFSFGDKTWMEFSVEAVSAIKWNESAFRNLVLPDQRKDLLRTLVEAHHQNKGFDDFIKGKGQGLVINLFGAPGVGKTFSAEATSEHLKRPLYIVGAGDLSTTAAQLDHDLERVFEVATTWKAIVLIDEADVFLEQRSLHDLARNSAVAVFLRHVEYYRGILFLTTNRVKAFDEAFLSRIHLALHFNQLDVESKVQIWTAFLSKIDATHISKHDIRKLAARDVNGRQIKNAAKTAHSLAIGRGETLSLSHFMHTLDAMEEFTRQFEAMRPEQ